ncbi:hypothetical protein [Naasia sp. SYSU D00057]|uniref:hypothetical protein n=1 Tax=Naasia sp. SYSU D00057 TaxID=2817380 RepID=UPI001B3085CF|nr:hypothetical protein [Naasia sp. SYSU D00057]
MGPRVRSASSLTGISAVLGGSLWVGHTILLAVRPLGCVGQACFEGARRHRESEDIAGLLLVSVLLLAVSVAAALREDGRLGRFRLASLVLLVLGAALLALGIAVNRGSSDGATLWWLHDSDTLGRIVPVLGTLMAGIAMLRDGTPRWLPALFLLAAAASFGVNIQDERALLGLPVGVAWAALGAHVLLVGRPSAAAPPKLPTGAGPVSRR